MMREDTHVSDEEILLFCDGELTSRRSNQVRSHLEACWACRTRVAEIEGTIADFIRIHHAELNSQLPPAAGPRALLKARMAEVAAQSRKTMWWEQLRLAFSGWPLAYACVVLVAIIVGETVIRHGQIAPGPHARFGQFKAQPIPNRELTPGATRPVTLADVCSIGYRDMNRVVPSSIRREVFKKYGMAGVPAEDYEVDYLITPELGGSDDIRNLWPEPYSSTKWNAHVKDALEDRMHRMVCEGKIDLVVAQHEMASDWISTYKKYFHSDEPLSIDFANRQDQCSESSCGEVETAKST